MTITVPRPRLNWRERLYLPAIAAGLAITFKHFKNMLLGRTKATMQYPEQKWDSHLPDHYRGAPALVRDTDGRVRCVACQLCEFICPPRAIKIIPGEIPPSDRFAKVEKFPQEFDINMIRCIYCGMCRKFVRSRRFICAKITPSPASRVPTWCITRKNFSRSAE